MFVRASALRRSGLTLSALTASCAILSLGHPVFADTPALTQLPPPVQRLEGHIPPVVVQSRLLGRLDGEAEVRLALSLPLRNQDQLNTLLERLYDPLDGMYGQFLTAQEFAAQFAPTQADYDAVRKYAESAGLKVVATHPNRLLLDVVGPSQLVERAFAVNLLQYRGPDGRRFHAPNSEPAIPAVLIGRLQSIVGLENAGVARPHLVPRRPGPIIAPHGGSGPGGGYAPSDIKTAYGLSGLSLNGSGQTLGLFELDGYAASDITAYENQFGLTHTPLQNVLVDGFAGGAGSGAGEVTLDIELMIALAPAATKIVVYEGPNSITGLVDTYNRIATDNAAKEISSSWGLVETSQSSSTRTTENNIFSQMATQGQSIYAAAGDSGAFDGGGSTLAVDDPASQPFMVGVGGTTLTTGTGGTYSSESTWSGGGGGISTVWSIPSYQSGVGSTGAKTSTTKRNVPDVSLNADPNTGYAIYFGGWQTYGGTSCAAPLWAAFTALVNQQRVANGSALLGFPNTALYTIGKGSNYSADFHDIANSTTNGFYPAVTGFDDATGWGTFKGAALLADLAGGGGVTIPAAPTGLTATAGSTQISLSWIGSSGATSYSLYRSNSTGTETSYKTGLTATTYTDTGLTNGTTYFYKVTALNSAGESAKSNEASATPSTGVTIPAAPTGLTATAGNAQVSLAWTGSSGATSYNLYRSNSTGTETSYRTGLTTTSYADTGLTNGTAYFYKVTAVNSAGESGKSNEASATPSGGGGGPQQLLGNPGFENGSGSPAPWVVSAGVIDSGTGEASHSGTWKAWLDGYGSTHTDTVYQQVAIPSTITTATLTFWLHIDTAETTTSTAYDTLKVQVRNSSGTVLATLATYSNLNKATGYSQKSFSLIAYKGQTIQIYLVGAEDSSLQTSFVVDDFALNVQ